MILNVFRGDLKYCIIFRCPPAPVAIDVQRAHFVSASRFARMRGLEHKPAD